MEFGQLIGAALTGGLGAAILAAITSGLKDRRSWRSTAAREGDALSRSRLMWRDAYYHLRRLLRDHKIDPPAEPDDPYPPKL